MKTESIESDSILSKNQLTLKNHFLGWQCRVREYAFRNAEGRPSPAMCPNVLNQKDKELATSVILLLIPKKPLESIQQFLYIAKKTNDPNERYKKIIQFLSSTFYQSVKKFDGVMSGLFSSNSLSVSRLLEEKNCILHFNYQQQSFRINCGVTESKKEELEYKFTFWHNFLFNPNLFPNSRVLMFKPDWSKSNANPPMI